MLPEITDRESLSRMQSHLAAKAPLESYRVLVGERLWHVKAVQNQDALLDAAEDMEHFPYGLLLWEASVGLARTLAAHPEWLHGRRILELGVGAGLPGMVARSLGAEVWQTDHQSSALTLAQINAFQNGVSGIQRFLTDWRVWSHTERYDILMGADILYEPAMYFYLEPIFRQNLRPGGTLLLSDPVRPQAMEFAAHLEKHGWHLTLETQWVQLDEDKTAPVEVAILLGEPR